MSEGSLHGRHALITGSTSGIGLEIARALALAGCDLTINGFEAQTSIDSICEELVLLADTNITYSDADMRDPVATESMISNAARTYGRLDILVNNAGIQHVSPIESFPVDKWNDIISINLSSAFHTIRAAIPIMRDSGWGRVINMASAHALVASPYKSAYIAAKHGLAGLTKTVALETAQQNITVNAIAPGYVKTPLVVNQIADTAKARDISEEEVIRDIILLAQPTRELITVEQVANIALFLCTDQARSITGSIISIDGGWTAQ